MAYLSKREIEELRIVREAGRKSLFFLCTRILGYADVDPVIHKPFIDPLDEMVAGCTGTDIIKPSGECLYIPSDETFSTAVDFTIKRRHMLQAFRGSLKTTINTIAHLIQLQLNFPHLASLIYHNTEDRAKLILTEIVNHYASERMREIYPDFALFSPTERRRAMSQNGFAFTSPARLKVPSEFPPKKEPTFTAVGLGSSQAGQHVSIIKMSDVVEETNSGTPTMRNKVYKNIQMAMNLLEDPMCLVFIEGTPYDPDDAYGRIVQREWFDRAEVDRSWHFTFLPAYQIDTRGKPRQYTPEELSLPWLRAKKDIVWSKYVTTKKGEYVPVWPVWRNGRPKFTNAELEKIRHGDAYTFACQQLLKPAAEDAAYFPPSKCFHRFPERELYKLDEQLRVMAVDTAETLDENYSNHTAISCATITTTLLRVVTHGIVDMLEAEEILDVLFDMYATAKPHVIFIEETSFVRGLKSQIAEREQRKNILLPIEYLTRKTNKKMRIKAALRAPLLSERLLFSTGLSDHYTERVMSEMSGFPKDKRDDVLDTLADICAATTEFQAYDNPKVRQRLEQEQNHKLAKQGFTEWANRMLGRIPPDDDTSGYISSPYGF